MNTGKNAQVNATRIAAVMTAKLLRRFGGPGRDRTDDLFHAMELK